MTWEQAAVGIICFVAGFIVGNLSKIEMRVIVGKILSWRRKQRKN